MPTNGQVAIGPNGERAVFQNGQWVVPQAPQQAPADPTFQYEAPKAQADAQRAQIGVQADQVGIANTQSTMADRAADNARADRAESRQERTAALTQRTTGAPAGYMWNPNGEGVVPIPGYVPDDEKKLGDPIQRAVDARGELTRLIQRIDSIAQDAGDSGGWLETGLSGGLVRGIPGTAAYGLAADLKTLDANAAFRALQKMRDESPTGGALGQITEKELDLLKSTVANLDPNQSQGDFQRKLQEARQFYVGMAEKLDRDIPADRRENVPLSPLQQDTTGSDPRNPSFGSAFDNTKSIPIPPAMQSEYEQYVQANRGNLNPESYADFRSGLDQKYGFSSDRNTFVQEGQRLGDQISKGQRLNLRIPPVQANMDAQDRINNAIFANPAGSFATGVADFHGGLDEMAAAVRTPFNDSDYATNLAQMDAAKQQLAGISPGANIAGKFAGGLATGMGLASRAPGAAAAITSSTPRLLGSGAAFGAGQGALETNDSRGEGAIIGGLAGVAGGLAGKYALAPAAERLMRSDAGQAVSKAARLGINRIRPGAVAPNANIPQISGADASIGSGFGDDVETARKNLADAARLGLPYSLADATPKAQALAGAVTRKSLNARELAENTVGPRQRGQVDRLKEGIDQRLAPITDIGQRKNELLDAGSNAADPYYAQAYAQDAMADPELQSIMGSRWGKQALGDAYNIAEGMGKNPTKLGFVLDEASGGVRIPDQTGRFAVRGARNEQGNVISDRSLPAGARPFAPADAYGKEVPIPTYETMHMVKRGFDSVVEKNRDALGKLDLRGNPIAQGQDQMRHRFNSRLGKLNPEYAEGNRVYERYAKQSNALERGHTQLPKSSVMPRDFDATVARARDYDAAQPQSAQTLPELQRGYATSMADKAENARYASNPYESVYGSPSQQQKVATLFPDGADDFARAYDLERDMVRTNYETLGGSPTAARLQADGQMGDAMGAGMEIGADVLTGGGASGLGALFRTGQKMLGDGMKLGIGKRGVKRADQIAPVLFDQNPQLALETMDALIDKQAQLAARKRSFKKRTGLFGSVAAPLLVTGQN